MYGLTTGSMRTGTAHARAARTEERLPKDGSAVHIQPPAGDVGGQADERAGDLLGRGLPPQRDGRVELPLRVLDRRGIVRDVHGAVDAATYPVLIAVARFQPISATALTGELGLDRSVISRRASRLTAAPAC